MPIAVIAPKPTFVVSDAQMAPVVAELKARAQAGIITRVPSYSSSEEEATAIARADPEAAFKDSRMFFFMPMRIP
jgi:hypothetical protein